MRSFQPYFKNFVENVFFKFYLPRYSCATLTILGKAKELCFTIFKTALENCVRLSENIGRFCSIFNSAALGYGAIAECGIKGIVSRKFAMLLMVSLES
jgi:hypothetical protein